MRELYLLPKLRVCSTACLSLSNELTVQLRIGRYVSGWSRWCESYDKFLRMRSWLDIVVTGNFEGIDRGQSSLLAAVNAAETDIPLNGQEELGDSLYESYGRL